MVVVVADVVDGEPFGRDSTVVAGAAVVSDVAIVEVPVVDVESCASFEVVVIPPSALVTATS